MHVDRATCGTTKIVATIRGGASNLQLLINKRAHLPNGKFTISGVVGTTINFKAGPLGLRTKSWRNTSTIVAVSHQFNTSLGIGSRRCHHIRFKFTTAKKISCVVLGAQRTC